jgi:hypothetical protein
LRSKLKYILFFNLVFSHSIAQANGAEAISQLGNSAMTMGMLIGSANAAAGTAQSGMCSAERIWFCIAAGLSFAQVPMSLMSGKSGKAAAKAVLSNGSEADWDTVDLGNGLTGAQVDAKFDSIESAFNQGKKDLATKGIDLDKNSIQTPKGAKPLSSMTSGKALADAGLISADQIGEADDVLKKTQARLQQIALQTSPGGGGGGGSSKAVKYEYQAPDYGSMFGDKEKPAAPQVAGLVKTIDGQPYGASINNIFDMIRNRYEIKTKEKFFVDK